MRRCLPAALAVALLAGCSSRTDPPVELVDLTGAAVRPLDDPALRATVFVFTRTDCPISNRYAPTVRTLYEDYAGRGVGFWLVYLDRDEDAGAIRAHLAEYEYPMPALRDVDHRFAIRTGAEVTPEAVIFDGQGRQVYRGRIDNRYADFGRSRQQATRHDVVEALEAVLAGEPVEVATTRAVGCTIADLR